ncbi:hypothetical protein ACFYQA_25825 [Streptomyces sp. NPDC005774]|uniref:hypothetical protein n=1 Tax=Streptomyces sp. NPDC005774 TaxID=3364728 RepID=UPI00368ABEFF
MSATALVRGVESLFKECEHPRSRRSKCPHPYKIRYRSAAGKQVKESGFATQDKAIARLTEVYNAKKAAPRGQAKAERIATYGAMRFDDLRQYCSLVRWRTRRPVTVTLADS